MLSRSDGNLQLRPMTVRDIPIALSIIREYDEDDADEAQETYGNSINDQYCMCENGTAIGVVGAKPIPETDGSFGLSWTYLHPQHRRSGKGNRMLTWMIEIMKERDGRKAFVHASDYIDPDQGDVYRDARDAYQQVGFIQEVRQNDYYAPGEAMLIYGLRLVEKEPSPIVLNMEDIRLTDVDEIPETDGAYWLAWELVSQGQGTKPQDFQRIIEQVRSWDGRAIFMAFPSDVANASSLLTAARFKMSGRLFDYYEDGIDEVHYRFEL
jgi:N-acetylglutamate synthase-like GNAT family acetyltransferase